MKEFRLVYIKRDTHLRLPAITSVIVVQNLYDILFQYLIDPDLETRLKELISRMESHIKSKSRAPFSLPVADLEFLGEGMEELKLLNWAEIPVATFAIESTVPDDTLNQEDMEEILDYLEDIFTFKHVQDNLLYVYPARLTDY